MKSLVAILLIIIFLNGIELKAQDKRHWQFEYLPGLSYVPPMPLSIHQDGFDELTMMAHYKTEPLTLPIYYSYRLSTWRGKKGWSIEMNHLKIYLTNTTENIEKFSVSHGYNQIFFNRHYIKEKLSFITGLGIVVGHPESTIRGMAWEEKSGLWDLGYYLSGISFQGGCYLPLINKKHFIIPVELKVTMGYGHIPIVDGYAQVPVVSINLLSGLGLKY